MVDAGALFRFRIPPSGESNVPEPITYQTPPYGAASGPGALVLLVEAASTSKHQFNSWAVNALML